VELAMIGLGKMGAKMVVRFLLNALEGDATLLTRRDGIEAVWRTIDPILETWEGNAKVPMATYEPGSWGPQSADALLARHKCCHDSRWEN